jgi:hypothetical protein
MNHIRPRLTFANVVSVVALFVALGGSAIAAVIITSNSQVAKDTISGHHPPSGDRPNIIGGSVNATDLATRAVTLAKVAPNSINGTKVVDGSLGPADVSNIVLRPAGSSDVSTGNPGVEVSYPLAHDTWTQKAGEVDLITGSATLTKPSACSDGGDPTSAVGEIDIYVDGSRVAGQILGSQPFGANSGAVLTALVGYGASMPAYVAAPASDTSHTITAKVSDFCFDPSPSQNFTIHSVNVQVTALR